MRKIRSTFTYVQRTNYIELYLLGQFICNCDNWAEVREEEQRLLYN
jgi:hypothetical protein